MQPRTQCRNSGTHGTAAKFGKKIDIDMIVVIIQANSCEYTI